MQYEIYNNTSTYFANFKNWDIDLRSKPQNAFTLLD